MFGDASGAFRPSASITRAEVAAILVRTELRNFPTSTTILPPGMTSFTAFSDVHYGAWYFFYVAWAFDANLVLGHDGQFRPGDYISRQELAAMVARLGTVRESGVAGFPDAREACDWAIRYVYTVYRNRLMQGDQHGFFQPQRDITRAETATVINRNLGRIDSHAAWEGVDLEGIPNVRFFPDVNPIPWYWPAVIGATNNHYLDRCDEGVINWKRIPTQR